MDRGGSGRADSTFTRGGRASSGEECRWQAGICIKGSPELPPGSSAPPAPQLTVAPWASQAWPPAPQPGARTRTSLAGPSAKENITPWPKVTKNFQTARAEREVSTWPWGLPRWQEEVASLGPLWPLPGPSHHPVSQASQLWFLPLPHPASGPVSLWASHTAWDRQDFLFYPRLF